MVVMLMKRGISLVNYFDTRTVNMNAYLYFSLGKSTPSRNPAVENIFPGFAADSVKHRPEGTKEDFTGTGSHASGKQPPNTQSWGTQKGIDDSREYFISSELNKVLKLKHIHLGKHFSKKVAHLLKSRPSLLAPFNKELKDASYHSSKLRDSHLHGLPKSINGTTMNSNEQGSEMDDQVFNSSLELTNPGTVSRKPPESDSPKPSLAHEKHEPHHKVPKTYTHVHLTQSDIYIELDPNEP